MATKKRFAAMASKRFSRRIRNRENINIEKDADKSIDIRKSADQFQQNEFLKLFQLERTSSPTDQSSQGQQTIATKMDSDINSSVSNIVFRGFSSSPVVASKRSRGGKLKSFDPRKFDDMSTHLSEQITSTGSFGKHLPADSAIDMIQNMLIFLHSIRLQLRNCTCWPFERTISCRKKIKFCRGKISKCCRRKSIGIDRIYWTIIKTSTRD